MALIPPFFLDCVVAIGTRPRRRAKAKWSASGFLYGQFISAEGDQKTYSIYLVTNRHVFARAKTVVLRFNPKGSEPAREFDERLRQPSGEPKWLAHPDPKIDIAVLPIIPAALDANGI